MNETTLTQALRQNWQLLLVLLAAVIAVGVGLFMALGGKTDVAAVLVTPLNPTTVMSEEEMRAVLFAPPGPVAPTPMEVKQKAVNEHRARYDANPDDPDAEPLLRAMGNLYKQTGDLANAAWAYGQFLKRFPDSLGRSGVYMELAGCYEQLNDADNLSRLYLEMMKVYPADSNEYKFAEASLHMTELKLKQRNPGATPQPGPEGTYTVETLPDGTIRYVEAVSKPVEGEFGRGESTAPDASAPAEPPAPDTSAPAESAGS